MIKDDRVLKLELDLIKTKMDEIREYVDRLLTEKESLIDTNPHLKDEAQRKKLIAKSVRSSCGVEGIKSKSIDSELLELEGCNDYEPPKAA